MKKLTQTTTLVIAFILLFSFSQCKDAKDAAVTKFMEVMAEQIDKGCPVNVGNGMTMTKCEVDGNKTIKYSFAVADEVSKMVSIGDHMKPAMIKALKEMPQFEQMKQFEITCAYAYYDTDDKLLGEIKITPEDYNKVVSEADESKAMLEMIVANTSPSLPVQVDEITMLTGIKLLENNILEYSYDISLAQNELDENFNEIMKNNLIISLKSNPQTKQMLSSGATFNYKYKDKNGKEFCQLSLGADDMK